MYTGSCPSWARGLKWQIQNRPMNEDVVPLVGTWIEILIFCLLIPVLGRAPRGHVD